jgi:hypothetical protein
MNKLTPQNKKLKLKKVLKIKLKNNQSFGAVDLKLPIKGYLLQWPNQHINSKIPAPAKAINNSIYQLSINN